MQHSACHPTRNGSTQTCICKFAVRCKKQAGRLLTRVIRFIMGCPQRIVPITQLPHPFYALLPTWFNCLPHHPSSSGKQEFFCRWRWDGTGLPISAPDTVIGALLPNGGEVKIGLFIMSELARADLD